MANFSNKIVWITGASSGIGEALAYAFASGGASLILSARTESALQLVAKNCIEKGASSAKVLLLDVADDGALAGLSANFDHTVGHVDILINNSGISQRSSSFCRFQIWLIESESMSVSMLAIGSSGIVQGDVAP
jgi:short-subunit dehydrogenase